jgi:hypothetical protein
MRKIESCLNCGEEREIAAKGFCFKCYRQQERSLSRGLVDRRSGAITRERQKLFAAYASLMVSLGRLGVAKPDIEDVIEIVRPYLVPISEQLRFAGMVTARPEEKSPTVNGEHPGQLFTVHKKQDSEVAEPQVNK